MEFSSRANGITNLTKKTKQTHQKGAFILVSGECGMRGRRAWKISPPSLPAPLRSYISEITSEEPSSGEEAAINIEWRESHEINYGFPSAQKGCDCHAEGAGLELPLFLGWGGGSSFF